MSQPGHLLLLDASGFAHRAFHAGSGTYRGSDGLPTWAIFGFLGLMWRMLGAAQHDQPTLAAAVFDAPGRNFRHDLYPAYKNNRPARDEELSAQMPYLRHAAAAMGITPVEAPGFEADDLIASLAAAAAAQGHRTTIVSSDKDFAQEVKDGVVEIVDPLAHRRWTESDIRGWKFGVDPVRVPDYQALAGDEVDNIPGLEGVGAKTAAALVRQFGTLEAIQAGLDQAPHYFPPGVRVRMRKPETWETLRLYRQIATLRRDVPLPVQLHQLELRPIMVDHVKQFLAKLEAPGRFDAIFATAPQTQRVVEARSVFDQFLWWEEELKAPGQNVWDEPQCGFFMRRLVRGGPFVPARIWRENETDPITGAETGQQILRCEVGNEARDPVVEWPLLAQRPITRKKYEFEIADRNWAFQYAPGDPKANPTRPVVLTEQPAVRCS